MRLPFAALSLLATLTPFAFAYPEIKTPAATMPFGSLAVSWADNGESPKISALDTYTLELVLGGDDPAETMAWPLTTTAGDLADDTSATGKLTGTEAGSTKNGYYFRMISKTSEGSVVTSYSSRFTVSGMTGVTPPAIVSAVPGGTAGPPDVNGVSPAAGGQVAAPAAGAAPPAGDYGIPYNEQTGTVRYAPMQPFPPTKITKKGKPTPQYPTSAYNIATARMPPPSVLTTITESQTVHAMTMENTVAPQAHPKDDMAKFMARWKD